MQGFRISGSGLEGPRVRVQGSAGHHPTVESVEGPAGLSPLPLITIVVAKAKATVLHLDLEVAAKIYVWGCPWATGSLG